MVQGCAGLRIEDIDRTVRKISLHNAQNKLFERQGCPKNLSPPFERMFRALLHCLANIWHVEQVRRQLPTLWRINDEEDIFRLFLY